MMSAIEQVIGRRRRTVFQEMDDATPAFLCAEYRAVRRDGKAIRASGVIAKDICLAGAWIEAQDALLLHRAEQHGFAIPGKTAGPAFVRSCHFFEFPAHGFLQ